MSHELVETLTDPQGSTWLDLNTNRTAVCPREIGDLCTGVTGKITRPSFGTVNLQAMFSNLSGQCEVTGPGAPDDEGNFGASDISLTGNLSDTSGIPALVNFGGERNGTNVEDLPLGGSNGSYWLTSWQTSNSGAWQYPGDFDGDGALDYALAQGYGWGSIPVAHNAGPYNVTNGGITTASPPPQNVANLEQGQPWPIFASQTNVPAVSGDFNGDGRMDLVLTGGSGWGSLPIAFGGGPDGTFWATNNADNGFNSIYWNAQNGNPHFVSADFDRDGRTDVALIGGETNGAFWTYIPIATSIGDGTWSAINYAPVWSDGNKTTRSPYWGSWAMNTYVQAITGDFNGDGLADVALVGGNGWGSIPIAFGQADGSFVVSNSGAGDNAYLAQQAQSVPAKIVGGDFDGDGRTDIGITGPAWSSVLLGYSNGDGSFTRGTGGTAAFASLANQYFTYAASASQDYWAQFSQDWAQYPY